MSIQATKYRVHLVFVSPLLGAVSPDKDVYEKYIAGRAEDPVEAALTELAALPNGKSNEKVKELIEASTTTFLQVSGKPALSNHTIW